MANKVIIPCAGAGTRFAMNIPKQYFEISKNKTVLDYTLESFLAITSISEIAVIVSPNDDLIDDILAKYKDNRLIAYKVGGTTRSETVLNGLLQLSKNTKDDDWILVHDAARCIITPELISKLMNELSNDMIGGILAIPVYDTIKQVINMQIKETLNRKQIYLAQTPQMFRYLVLINALANIDLTNITDEASAVEQLGLCVKIVNGDVTNIKITHMQDLELAKFFLMQNNN